MIGDNIDSDIVGAIRVKMVAIQKRHQGVVVYKEEKEKADFIFDEYDDLRKIFI